MKQITQFYRWKVEDSIPAAAHMVKSSYRKMISTQNDAPLHKIINLTG